MPQPPANDSDGGVGGEANPTDNEDGTHKADDLMRLVQARTLPARLSLLANTAKGLVDDLDQLSSAGEPPPRSVMAAGRLLVGMAQDLHALVQSLSFHKYALTGSELLEQARLLWVDCEEFQSRVATLTVTAQPPLVSDAVTAAGLAQRAENLHQFIARRELREQ